jgi:hypothetical protein
MSNDTFKAEALYAACNGILAAGSTQADRDTAETICTVYLRGLTDGMFVMQSLASQGKPTCMSSDQPVSVPQARATFGKWLRQHPEKLQSSAGVVAAFAQILAHQCG